MAFRLQESVTCDPGGYSCGVCGERRLMGYPHSCRPRHAAHAVLLAVVEERDQLALAIEFLVPDRQR